MRKITCPATPADIYGSCHGFFIGNPGDSTTLQYFNELNMDGMIFLPFPTLENVYQWESRCVASSSSYSHKMERKIFIGQIPDFFPAPALIGLIETVLNAPDSVATLFPMHDRRCAIVELQNEAFRDKLLLLKQCVKIDICGAWLATTPGAHYALNHCGKKSPLLTRPLVFDVPKYEQKVIQERQRGQQEMQQRFFSCQPSNNQPPFFTSPPLPPVFFGFSHHHYMMPPMTSTAENGARFPCTSTPTMSGSKSFGFQEGQRVDRSPLGTPASAAAEKESGHFRVSGHYEDGSPFRDAP